MQVAGKRKMRTKVTVRVMPDGRISKTKEVPGRKRTIDSAATSAQSKPKKPRIILRGLCEQCKKKHKPAKNAYEELTKADIVMLHAATEGHLNCVQVCLTAGTNVNQLVPLTINRRTASFCYENSTTALMKASQNGHQECLSLLIESGADVNFSDENGPTALFYAASAGKGNCVDLLLKAGADVNIFRCSTSPLNVAIRSSKFSTECINTLIEGGAYLNKQSKDGDTPLLAAISQGNTEYIKLLLKAGADVNKGDMSSKTPLIRAIHASNDCSLSFKALIDAGADVNAKTSSSKTALHYTAELGKTKLASMLLKAGGNVNVVDSDGNSALMCAVERGFTEIVQTLIHSRVDVNSRNKAGDTALILAASRGQKQCLEKLIRAGSNVNCRGHGGRTALMTSVGNGDCLKLLIDAGADVNRRKDDGETALKLALANKSSDCLNQLIQAGADVNLAYADGKTAMSIASFTMWRNSHVSSLIAAGATVNVRNSDGKTILMCAAEKGCTDIVHTLIQAGVDVNIWSRTGETALILAAAEGHKTCLETLIRAGTNVNSRDWEGETALMKAVSSEDSMRCLIESGADVNKLNKEGKTALSPSSSIWKSVHVHSLIAVGADANVVDFYHNTPLHLILQETVRSNQCCSEAIECIKFLLGAGAKINMLNIEYEKTLASYFQLRNKKVNTPLHRCLLETLHRSLTYRGSASPLPSVCNGACEAQMITLFFAAGETVDHHPVKISDYLDPPSNICLNHICREVIREYLLQVDLHGNLFCRVQQLGLPSALQEYLLYNVALDEN